MLVIYIFTFVIFLFFNNSIRAGGIGINLQAADTVLIYDTDWNPQVFIHRFIGHLIHFSICLCMYLLICLLSSSIPNYSSYMLCVFLPIAVFEMLAAFFPCISNLQSNSSC